MSPRIEEFVLVVSGTARLSFEDFDALYESGCDDATFAETDGELRGYFRRETDDLGSAIETAIQAVEATLPGARVVRVEPDDLVTVSGIAQRTRRSRESVRLLIVGKRGPGGFPAPVSNVDGRKRLWKWADVAAWFEEYSPGDQSGSVASATTLAKVNTALQLRQADMDPDVARLVGLNSAAALEESAPRGEGTNWTSKLASIANPVLGLISELATAEVFAASPVGQAIERTQQVFEQSEVSFPLTNWCSSSDFRELLTDINGGQREFSLDDLVRRFETHSDFYWGDPQQTHAAARDVLRAFLVFLVEEIHAGVTGLPALARRNEILHSETHASQRQHSAAIEEVAALVRQIAGEKESAEENASHPQATRTLEVARNLLSRGSARAALQLAQDVQADLAGVDDARSIMARAMTIQGAALIELGDLEEAIQQLSKANSLHPSGSALSNLALAQLLTDNLDDALHSARQSVEIAAEDAHAQGVLLSSLYRTGRNEEFEERAALVHPESEVYLKATLGVIRLAQDNFQEAEKWLRDAISSDTKPNAELHVNLGTVLYEKAQHELQADPPLDWRMPRIIRQQLRDAHSEFSNAISILEGTDSRSRLHDALASRAAVSVLLDESADAMNDLDRVLTEDPDHPIASANKGLLLITEHKVVEALPYIKKSFEADPNRATALRLAYVLAEQQKHSQALGILEPYIEEALEHCDSVFLDTLLKLHHQTHRPEDAEIVLTRMAPTRDPGTLWTLARHKKRSGDATFLDDLRAAHDLASGNERERIALELADSLFDQDDFAGAATLYGAIVDTDQPTPLLRRYAAALFNSGALSEALAIAQGVREKVGRPLTVFTEIEALVLAHMGNLEEAQRAYLALADSDDGRPEYLLQAASLALRGGDRNRARSITKRVREQDLNDDPQGLLHMANLRQLLGSGDPLAPAFQARRLGFDDPSMHLGYVGVFLGRDTEVSHELDVEFVGIDTAVTLKRGSDARVFWILEDDLVSRSRWELKPSDELARKLLGKRKGDVVPVREGPEHLEYEVLEVRSKYVAAFQETLQNFGTWFPENNALMALQVKDDDVTSLVQVLEGHKRQTEESLELYQKQLIPVPLLAKLTGKHPLEAWFLLLNDASQSVKVSSGNAEDFAKEVEAAADAQTLVFDTSSLGILADFGVLSRLEEGPASLWVAGLVVEELNQHIEIMRTEPDPTGELSGGPDGIHASSFTPEAVQKRREYWLNLQRTVRETLQSRPVEELITGGEGVEELAESLGKETVATMLLAKGSGRVMVCDDLAIRLLAKEQFGVDGTWSQPLLISMAAQGLISDDEYVHALEKLALSHYLYLRVTPEDAMAILRSGDFAVSGSVDDFLHFVLGKHYGDTYATALAADVLKDVWLEPLVPERKLLLLDRIADALTRDRLATSVLSDLKTALTSRLALLPHASEQIVQSIDLWMHRNQLSQGLIQ